jgi:D-threo-aldose 1-dehydrogenase
MAATAEQMRECLAMRTPGSCRRIKVPPDGPDPMIRREGPRVGISDRGPIPREDTRPGAVMETRRLGSTDVYITVLGFGAAPIGNLFHAVDDDSAHAALNAAWEGGVRYFDTAPHYGLGLSERRLGRSLTARPRRDFVVSTKVGRLLVPNPTPTGSDLARGGFDVSDELTRVRDYSRDGVLRSLDASLARLRLDQVDIVFVHDPEDHMDVALADAFPTLVELREQGVVRAIGAGMNLVPPLRRIVREADVDAVMVAGRYTLVDRSGEDLLDECRARGVAVVAAAPFNSGLLARDRPEPGAHFDYAEAALELVERASALATVCHAHDVALPQAALAFPMRHPAVASVVAGFGTAPHVLAALEWASQELPADVWDALERVR